MSRLVSTTRQEKNMNMDMNMNMGDALSSEDSSCPDESELELGLGLSLGCNNKSSSRTTTKLQQPHDSSISSSSSSSSSLSRANANVTAGTKRTADSSSQVVGWPPIRTHRMNSMANQAKSTATEGYGAMVEKGKRGNTTLEKRSDNNDKYKGDTGERRQQKSSMFRKVNIDGCPIGRKVDLSAYGSYEKLAQTLEDMFFGVTKNAYSSGSAIKENDSRLTAGRSSKLLNGSFEYVLTYEDKEGDWMMVGDVPWGMFINCVKRLKIMKTSEANGLDPRVQENNARARNKPI